MPSVTLHTGDCLDVMRGMPEASVDAIVCDPPYGLEFMGKEWDHGVPGEPFWIEALRVAKPGSYLVAFGGTRTFHRLAVAIEDAGWEMRDSVMWVYGTGYPKSHDVSKAIDKAAGVERTVVVGTRHRNVKPFDDGNGWNANSTTGDHEYKAPATDEAKKWEGWGTALKPAWEPAIMARKPLAGSVVENVLEFGTGAINIDACRIPGDKGSGRWGSSNATVSQDRMFNASPNMQDYHSAQHSGGRWPANLMHDGSPEVLACFPENAGAKAPVKGTEASPASDGMRATGFRERVPGVFHNDSGSPARFFYCGKASRSERDAGLEAVESQAFGMSNGAKAAIAGGETYDNGDGGINETRQVKNYHPTVKPIAVMRWLVRLVTPVGGVCLDPFMGSGTTGIAAKLEGMQFIGIDKEPGHVDLARLRIAHWQPETVPVDDGQESLFP